MPREASLLGEFQDMTGHNSQQPTLGWPCLIKSFGPEDIWRLLPTWAVLWFCKKSGFFLVGWVFLNLLILFLCFLTVADFEFYCVALLLFQVNRLHLISGMSNRGCFNSSTALNSGFLACWVISQDDCKLKET